MSASGCHHRKAIAAVTLFFVAGVSLRASGGETRSYLPFQFDDPGIAERPDIKDLIRQLQAPVSPETAGDISSLRTSDADLSFFSEIARVLRRVGPQPTRVSQPGSGAGLGCGSASGEPETVSLEAQLGSLGRVVRESDPGACVLSLHFDATALSRCPAVTEAMREALGAAGEICLSAYEPERFVGTQVPGKNGLSFLEMVSLDGLIKTAGEPLSHIGDFPPGLVTPELKSGMRTILAKIRRDELAGSNRKQIRTYDSMMEALGGSPPCGATRERLRGLKDELESANAYLDRLDQRGREKAEAERKAVIASGRHRDPLPYPSLTDEERQLLSLYLGGVYWRMRGGGLIPTGQTQKARIYFNLMPMRMIGYINGGRDGVRAADRIFARIFRGWSRWMDMGRTPGHERYLSLARMTDRGLYQVDLAQDFLRARGYDPADLRVGGLQMGPCYYYAWDRLRDSRIWEHPPPPYSPLVDGPTAWGELCAGASISLGLSKTLLKGTQAP